MFNFLQACLFSVVLVLGMVTQSFAQIQFVENKGQFEKEVLFRVQLNTGYVFLEQNAITFKLFNENEYHDAHRHLHEDTLSREAVIHGHVFKYKF